MRPSSVPEDLLSAYRRASLTFAKTTSDVGERPRDTCHTACYSARMEDLAKRIIDRIDNAAAVAGDSAAVRLRKTLLIFLGAAGVLLGPVAGYYLGDSGERPAALVAFTFAGVSAAGLLHMLVTKRERLFAWLELCALLVAPCALQWFLGGFRPSGASVLWSLLSPLCALV